MSISQGPKPSDQDKQAFLIDPASTSQQDNYANTAMSNF